MFFVSVLYISIFMVPVDGFQLKPKQFPQYLLRHYQGVDVTVLPFFPLFNIHVTTGCHT
jgi:hypothetical protein